MGRRQPSVCHPGTVRGVPGARAQGVDGTVAEEAISLGVRARGGSARPWSRGTVPTRRAPGAPLQPSRCNGLLCPSLQRRRGRASRRLAAVSNCTPCRQGCSKVRPVEGRECSGALKSEDRRPKPERRPKSEFREWPDSTGGCSAGLAINSDLGLRVSFGLRSSGLGFGLARADFRAALGCPPVPPNRIPPTRGPPGRFAVVPLIADKRYDGESPVRLRWG